MVKSIIEEIRGLFPSTGASEVSCAEKGYHAAIDADKSNAVSIAEFFDRKGFYLVDLFCVDYVEYLEVVYFFNSHSEPCRVKATLKLDPERLSAPTISHIYKMAHYYEREVHEFFGVFFEGHPNMAYLFLHDGLDIYPLRKNSVAVTAEDRAILNSFNPQEQDDTFFMNMGPQHPSTHGGLRLVLKMDGEYIMNAEPVLGYVHRMHEKMAENRGYVQFLPNTSRIDYVGAMTYNLGYAETVERLCSIEVPERAHFIRTITCELNRIGSHLLWFGAFLNDLGAVTPFLYAFDDREQILDILEHTTGARLTFNYFRFGGLFEDAHESFADATRVFVKRMWKRLSIYEKLVTKNVIFRNRVKGIGVLDYDVARSLGCSGPVIRSTGTAYDIRKAEPYAAYDKVNFEVPTGTTGDNLDRYSVRLKEIETSLRIIEQAVDMLPSGPHRAEKVPRKLKPPKGDFFHAVESPRGELGIYIVSDETDVPYRMRWRVPSFSNVMIFPELARGVLISDAVSILGTTDIIVPEIDR